MTRRFVFLALLLLFSLPGFLPAYEDDGPPIAITSPDTATTFAFGSVKSHALIWNKQARILIAIITFTDAEQNIGTPNDDTHQFRLPGVTYDEAKGLFFATTARGEAIPVAAFKTVLFFKTIETTPNALVRILHPRGNVTVILEAIRPNDPALRAAPSTTDPDGTHKVDINSILR
jgi:hypothetical protein